jgi:hypothetical protein
MTDVEVLQYALGLKTSKACTKAEFLIVGLDQETYTENPKAIMEFSVPVLDTRDIAPGDGTPTILQRIKHNQFRIREMAQYKNDAPYLKGKYNKHDKFEFGRTEWTSKSDVKDLLTQLVCVPDEATGRFRSVILVGHALHSDLGPMKQEFGFSFSKIRCIDRMIDLQDLAQAELDFCQPSALEPIMAELDISSKHLHNSGNDATYQMICAIMIATMNSTPALVSALQNLQLDNDKSLADAQMVIESIKETAKAAGEHASPVHAKGSLLFCTRCGMDGHDNLTIRCDINHTERNRCKSRAHMTHMCPVGARGLAKAIKRNEERNAQKDRERAKISSRECR